MERDECENADHGARGARVDQKESCGHEPACSEHHAQPAKALAEGRGPDHGHPEENEPYRQNEETDEEQGIEYALVRPPQEYEGRLLLGGSPRSMVEVGEASC